MKPLIRSRAARLISAIAALFVITSGIAYAGVDPIGQGTSVTGGAAGATETAVQDTVVTDATMPGDDGKDRVREIPEDVAAALESLGAYRTAAREWKECVRGVVRDADEDAAAVDISTCGASPAAADYGLTEEAIAELPEKAAARIGRVVAAIEARVACIVAHAGDAEALHACFEEVADEFGAKRAETIRERRAERGDATKLDERRAQREERREQRSTDREEDRSHEERPSNREVRGDQTRIHPGQDRNETSARRNG